MSFMRNDPSIAIGGVALRTPRTDSVEFHGAYRYDFSVYPSGVTSRVISLGGRYNDGPNGEPALTYWRADGSVESIERLCNDARNDGPNGEPAVVRYDRAGNVVERQYWKNNLRLDHFDHSDSRAA